ncbi:hypothetical protein HMPREF1318_2657 [Actinomyces massiliensis F0489]|uniref:Uncharacterized protein n=1 Tax=Actinomyces massiliensis F0489 TaxID=1125718 RepID=J0MSV0_9ACTO|nr:hypothetical protein HMPREF1318_2657 [Actinomyces massiliensis F0489]
MRVSDPTGLVNEGLPLLSRTAYSGRDGAMMYRHASQGR